MTVPNTIIGICSFLLRKHQFLLYKNRIYQGENTKVEILYIKQKPSATDAESLLESFYNSRIYKEGYNLNNNKRHHNDSKKEHNLTALYQQHNNDNCADY